MNGEFATLHLHGEQIGGLVDWSIEVQILNEKPIWSMTSKSYYRIGSGLPDEVRAYVGNLIWSGEIRTIDKEGTIGPLHNDGITIVGRGEILPCGILP